MGYPPSKLCRLPPFSALSSNESTIEIQTNGSIAGFSLDSMAMPHPLTIQAGAGYQPVINSTLSLVPADTTPLITLRNLNVNTAGSIAPLAVGGNLTAINCIFNANPAGGGNYVSGVSAAYPSPTTTATLTLTSCTLRGHNGLQAGRSCENYIIDRCDITGQVTDLAPVYSGGIINSMNWYTTFGSRMDATQGLDVISTPRVVTITNSTVHGGVPLAWPPTTLPNTYYQDEFNTVGPVNAVNTVFDSQNINGAGEANRISTSVLPAPQNTSSTFKHCTFRSANAWGAFYFYGGPPATYTYLNCLFDNVKPAYGIGLDPKATAVTLAGDGNAYYMPAGSELYPYNLTPFEATEHSYLDSQQTDPPLTDNYGNLQQPKALVVANALPLTPPVLQDKDGNPRPMPASAARSDIGADEIDETAPAAISDWAMDP